MKKIYLILITLFIPYILYGQTSDDGMSQVLTDIIPPSPQAAAYARYGEYPVDYSTGVPKIEIPIYTIKVGNFELPISLSYHASGIKITDVATPVGLGWVMNAGGIISRTMCSAEDLQDGSNMGIHSAEEGWDYINNKTKSHFYWKLLSSQSPTHDSQSDRYSYNFNGKSGIFRYDINTRDINPIPHSPIKIEDIATGGYKITDTDGSVYIFDARELSNNPDRAAMPSSWYVSKIITGDTKEEILFSYKEGSQVKQYHRSYYCHKGTEYYVRIEDPADDRSKIYNREVRKDGQHWSTTIDRPLLLESITWRNNKALFSYEKTRLDLQKDRLVKVVVKNHTKEVRVAELNNSSYFGTTPTNYRMRLDALSFKGNSNSTLKEVYQFRYTQGGLPDYLQLEGSNAAVGDYWGYCNGAVANSNMVPIEYIDKPEHGANRTPSATAMKAGSLTEIIYPTGGSTTFVLEANQVDGKIHGGLRVKSIINKDIDGSILNTKNYSYDRAKATVPIQKELYYKRQRYRYYYYSYKLRENSIPTTHEVWTSTPILSLTGLSGKTCSYYEVTEYDGTAENPNGKTVYNYLEDIPPINPCLGSDLYYFYEKQYSCDQGFNPYILSSKTIYDYSDNEFHLKWKQDFIYSQFDRGYFRIGVAVKANDICLMIPGSDHFGIEGYLTEDDYVNTMYCYDIFGLPSIRLLSSSVTTDYDNEFTTTTNYVYDPDLRTLSPVRVSTITSTGESQINESRYPFHLSGSVYSNMVNANVINPVVESRKYIGNTLLETQVNHYTQTDNRFLLTKISKSTGNGSLEDRIFLNDYNSKNNIGSSVKDSIDKVVYLWSYNHQYPIAKIENADYNTVATALGFDLEALANKNVPSDNDLSAINNLRTHLALKNALITTFTYDPLVGMTSSTDSKGLTTFYVHDDLGRLKKVYCIEDWVEKILQSYEYNYVNQ